MADPYLLPGTEVLRNRCGVTDAAVLADFELKTSLARVAELELHPVEGDFDLRHQARRVFGAIADDNYLVGLGREPFVVRLAGHWGEVNALHPFREGNTRTQRVFFQQLAWVAGWPIDWTRVDYAAFIKARYENLCTANVDALVKVLEPAVGQAR